jgi:hypothetical protein
MKHALENHLSSLRLIEVTEYAVVFGVALVFVIGMMRLVGLVR